MNSRIHIKIRGLALGLFLSTTMMATDAQADKERVSVAVFAVAKDSSGNKKASALTALLRERVKNLPNLRLVEPGQMLAGDQRTGYESFLDRAREALADGRRMYDAMGLDESIARLGQAINFYEQTGPFLGDLEELKTALSYLGAALILRGSADEGQSTFAELLTLDPSYTLQGFNPLVTKVFDKAVEQVAGLGTGKVEIYSTPPNAAVFVDGNYRGVSPITLDDLNIGNHHLRIEKNGYASYGGVLKITNDQSLTSQTRLESIARGPELRDLLARVVGSIERGGMDGNLRELARLLMCDALVILSVSQSGNDISALGGVFDRTQAKRIADERAMITSESRAFRRESNAYLDRVVKHLASMTKNQATGQSSAGPNNQRPSLSGFGLGEGDATKERNTNESVNLRTGQTPVEDVRVPSAPVVDGAPEPMEILGWGLVGVGVAGLITGSVFAGLAKQTHTNFLNTPQNSPDLPLIQNDGKTQALAADISFGVGGLVTLVGASILTARALRRPAPTELIGQNETATGQWPKLGFAKVDDQYNFSVTGVWP